MRYLINFSYDGSKFDGYQKQVNKHTIQEDIENILTSINNNNNVKIISSGRTDKGVHAYNQYAHFDLNVNITTYGIKSILNKKLDYIYIKSVEKISPDFHTRYNVKKKTYCYYINMSSYDIFKKDYIYQYNKDLDINKMNKAIKHIIGKHDFRGFCKDNKNKTNCIRTIYDTHIEVNNNIISIYITGDGFLRKMVRNIVGELIEVGNNNKKPKHIEDIIKNEGKIHSTKCCPGCGLYLFSVYY